MLKPGTAQTFEDYFNYVFAPYIARQLETVQRVDVVWDVYHEDSLKRCTREKRGYGRRRKMEIANGKEIYATHGETVMTSSNRTEMNSLSPCSHEEADTRLMVHALDASLKGHRRVKIRTNDTDVVVLAISVANTLPADEMWITFGLGKHVYNLAAHSIATSLGQDKASTAWDTWMVFPELTPVLRSLKSSPANIAEDSMDVIERFVVLLYDRTSSLTKVNESRQELFSKKSRNLDNIPPTRAALVQHTKRAVFQGGYWLPYWTSLPQVKDTCSELIKCSCKSACRGRCKCSKANLACTGLCKCGGNCN
ncbi:unnamed protein product [Porites lobata]|uniref:Tesmin/TSO1-like CXC domain-containing protein n=1 Tax=Porites lobata TaxID=104759 RepID=A0ABN8RUN6_9CNID|nr:unnamed protein product [Porites lobata]